MCDVRVRVQNNQRCIQHNDFVSAYSIQPKNKIDTLFTISCVSEWVICACVYIHQIVCLHISNVVCSVHKNVKMRSRNVHTQQQTHEYECNFCTYNFLFWTPLTKISVYKWTITRRNYKRHVQEEREKFLKNVMKSQNTKFELTVNLHHSFSLSLTHAHTHTYTETLPIFHSNTKIC